MAETMHKLLVGHALSDASRELLREWLLANTTGAHRLKAGLPAGWRIGDKTGTNRRQRHCHRAAARARTVAGMRLPRRQPAASAPKDATPAAVGRMAGELLA